MADAHLSELILNSAVSTVRTDRGQRGKAGGVENQGGCAGVQEPVLCSLAWRGAAVRADTTCPALDLRYPDAEFVHERLGFELAATPLQWVHPDLSDGRG